MIKIHQEGKKTLQIVIIILLFFNIAFLSIIVFSISLLILLFFASFFRNPKRNCIVEENIVYAPADGKIVVIEETKENEYFNDKRIQVSIFMSVWDVHVNWFPINGEIKYYKYHPGNYFLARHPKSSTENERNTIVIETPSKSEILLRQIAGAVARRIVFFGKENQSANQGEQMGFIKFGSRVDIFLPIGTKILVNLNDKTKGNKTVIAKLAE